MRDLMEGIAGPVRGLGEGDADKADGNRPHPEYQRDCHMSRLPRMTLMRRRSLSFRRFGMAKALTCQCLRGNCR